MAAVDNLICLLIFLQCLASFSEGSDEIWWNHEFVFSIPAMLPGGIPVVYITTSSTQTLRTTLEYLSTGYTVSSNVSRSSPVIIKLESDNVGIPDIPIEPHDGPQNKTIIIRSEMLVSVHAAYLHVNGDGFVVYPNSQLGTDYYVASYTPYFTYTSFFCVSSIRPDTVVNIRTKTGTTHSVYLMKYDTYRFDGKIGEDLSGSLVQSDKPIAVIAGVVARIPTNVNHVDGILAQLTPTNQWGSNFILTPFLTLTSGYVYRIYSMNVETTVTITDNVIIQLEQESYFEGNVEGDDVVKISADQPVMVVQYTRSGGYNPNPKRGDPSMVVIPPITSFKQGMVTFPVMVNYHSENFINVVTYCDNVDGLFLDNSTNIRDWDRLTTEDNEICCVRGSVTSGQHTVSHTDPTALCYVLVYVMYRVCCATITYTANTYYVADTSDMKSVTTVQQLTDIPEIKDVTTMQQFTDTSVMKSVNTVQQFTDIPEIKDVTTMQQLTEIFEGSTSPPMQTTEIFEGSTSRPMQTTEIFEGSTSPPMQTTEIFEGSTSPPMQTTEAVSDFVKVVEVKQTQIVISWQTFQADENIEHFRVFYNTGDSLNLNVADIVEVNGAMSMTVLFDLAATTLYTVRVEAYTETGRVVEVGEVQVTTTSKAPTPFNITLVIGIVVGVVIFAITIIVIGVVIARKRHRKKTSYAVEYETTIHDMTELQEPAGGVFENPCENEGYEAPPVPPVNLDSEDTYATPDIPHGDRTYQGLDGTQGQRTYHGLQTKKPSNKQGSHGDVVDEDQGYEQPSGPPSDQDLIYIYATSDSNPRRNESDDPGEYSYATLESAPITITSRPYQNILG